MNRASRYSGSATFLAFMRFVIVAFFVCVCHRAKVSDGKVFERCELAQVLRYGHGLDVNDVANWVCIAQHSSSLNTSAFGGNARSGGSHGLFQISDQYWCSPPGKGVACGVSCDRLRDDDISDDLACVQIIYEEHQRLSGDGYNAWVAYQSFCRDNPYEYVEDCFGNEEREYLHSKSLAANVVEDEEEDDSAVYSRRRGKVYGRCELAKELFLKHKMPMEEIPTWVCIAQHESNYDTSAVGRLNADGSADHGLFQISDLYWCHHKGGRRKACGMPCSKLLDTDITDDVKCVKQIYKEHTRLSGDGFTAWTVYNAHCRGNMAAYVRGCFDGIDVEQPKPSEEYRKTPGPAKVKSTKPHGKIYEPCELAEELRTKHHVPEDQIATWVCIAKHESDYNTSAIGYGDHGLFQISDIYWCSPPGKGWACGLSCADLEDSDITDDVKCIRKIYNEHTRLTGDGFNAWTVYPRYCSQGRSAKYIAHCSSNHEHPQPTIAAQSQAYSRKANPNSIVEYEPKKGKVYGRCELAKELLEKHDMDMDEISTWVCIAHHESNFDTSAVGRLNADGSADHGLFQISDLFWCSHKEGHRKACGVPCSKLLDNDISDDVRCVKQIHTEHTRISGDGFTAWTVYNPYCKGRTEQYIRGCFDGSADEEDFEAPQRALTAGYVSKNKPKGKVFEECELAVELRDRHRVPKEQIATWVCIAQHQSGLNTSSSVSNVHGLFHISDEFWCSPPGKGQACELNCADLEDSDITDDVQCIQKIYQEHQRLFGDGFNAWVVYPQHCSQGKANDYIGHCAGFKSTTANSISYGGQQGVIKTHPKLGGRVIEISNKPVFSHEFQANPFLKHFELVNKNAIAATFTQPIVNKPTFDHVFNANPFLKHFDTVSSKIIVPTSTQAPTSKPTFSHEFSVNPFLRHYDTKSKVSPSGLFSTPQKSTEEHVQTALNSFSLNPFLRTIPAGSAVTTTLKPVFGGVSTTLSTPPPVFGSFSIRPTPTRTKTAIGVKTYFPQNEEKAKYEAFKSLAPPYLPLGTQTPRANRLQTYTLNTGRSPISPTSATYTTPAPGTTRVPWYQLNTLNSAKPIVKPESTNGFFFKQDFTTSTSKPFSSTSLTKAKPFSLNSFSTPKPHITSGASLYRGAPTSTHTTTLRPVTVVSFSTVKPQGASFNRAAVSPVQTVPSRPFSAFSSSSPQGFSGFSFNGGASPSTQTTTLRPITSFNRAVTQATTSKPFSVFLSNTAKPWNSSGFGTQTVQTTTLRPISSSYSSRVPSTSVREDTGRYDPGRYDARRYDSGRYNSGRYDSGRYDSGKYNPQSVSRTTSHPATTARTTPSSFGHYSTPTSLLHSHEQTTSRISVTTLKPSSPVITLPHPTTQPQASRFLSKFLSSEEDDSLPQASNTNEQTIRSFTISNPLPGVKITNVGKVGISVHRPPVTSQSLEQQYLSERSAPLATPSLHTDVIDAFQLTGSNNPATLDNSFPSGGTKIYIAPSSTSKLMASETVKHVDTSNDSKSLETFDVPNDSSLKTLESSEMSKESNLKTLDSLDSLEVSSQTSSKDPDLSDTPKASSSDVPEPTTEATSGMQEEAVSQTELHSEVSAITPTPVDSSQVQSSSMTAEIESTASLSSEPAVPVAVTAEQESSKPESESVKQPLNPSITLKSIPKNSSAFTAGPAISSVALSPTSTAPSQTVKSSFGQIEALTPTQSISIAAKRFSMSSTSKSQFSPSFEAKSSILMQPHIPSASLMTDAHSIPSASSAHSSLRRSTTLTSSNDPNSVMATTVQKPAAATFTPKVLAASQSIQPSMTQSPISTKSKSLVPLPTIITKSPTATRPPVPSQLKPTTWISSRSTTMSSAKTTPASAAIITKPPTATRLPVSNQSKRTTWTWSRSTATSTAKTTPAPAKSSLNPIKSAPTFIARPTPTPTLKKSEITSVRTTARPATFSKPRQSSSASRQSAFKPSTLTSTKSCSASLTPPSRQASGTSNYTSIVTTKSTFSTGSSRSTRSIIGSSSSARIFEPNQIIVTKPIKSTQTRPSFSKTSAPLPSPSTVIKTRANTSITPTKSRRPPGSLFSTKLNIYDFYSKLYGSYPPTKTSSTQPAASKTRQINVAPSRTS